jgi:DNA-binding NarL/FixJ family response regulator
MMSRVRIVLIDSHDEVRRALAARLRAEPGFEVVGETGDGSDGRHLVEHLRPDVALVDPKRHDGRGLELISALTRSARPTPVLALTSYVNDWECWAVERAGARGYLLKEIGLGSLVTELRHAASAGAA